MLFPKRYKEKKYPVVESPSIKLLYLVSSLNIRVSFPKKESILMQGIQRWNPYQSFNILFLIANSPNLLSVINPK